jgi:hypothetical protein
LAAAFWDWCESVYDEPEDDHTNCERGCNRTDPIHEYAEGGTKASFAYGNRCMNCGTRDDKRRAHNGIRCVRPHLPELA